MADFLKKTCYKAGGLLRMKPDLTLASGNLSTGTGQPPLYIDNRGILLPADDQGQTPMCAAYSMATVIEVALWKKTRVRTTIDPVPIYTQAKKIDGNNEPGTYLDSVFKAALDLNLISPNATMQALRNRMDVKFAIREFEVCLLGLDVSRGWNNVDQRTGYIGPEKESLGGHAVVACWYNDTPGARDNGVGIGNSWSTSWGVNGFGRMTWEQFDAQLMYGLVVKDV